MVPIPQLVLIGDLGFLFREAQNRCLSFRCAFLVVSCGIRKELPVVRSS